MTRPNPAPPEADTPEEQRAYWAAVEADLYRDELERPQAGEWL